jgi:hypothetical protein
LPTGRELFLTPDRLVNEQTLEVEMMATATRPEPIHPDSHLLIGSDRIEGTVVRRPDGSKLGEIQRLMIDKVTGRVSYAVMIFGGFFTLGGKYHAVSWDKLTYDPKLGAYELDLTATELHEAAEREADAFDWGERMDAMIADTLRRPTHWGI